MKDKQITLTNKQTRVANLLILYEKGVNVYDFIKDNEKTLLSIGINTKKINSANATLASLATKGLVDKSKVAYNDKMITNYKANQKLIDLLKSLKENN